MSFKSLVYRTRESWGVLSLLSPRRGTLWSSLRRLRRDRRGGGGTGRFFAWSRLALRTGRGSLGRQRGAVWFTFSEVGLDLHLGKEVSKSYKEVRRRTESLEWSENGKSKFTSGACDVLSQREVSRSRGEVLELRGMTTPRTETKSTGRIPLTFVGA